jgi:hypothetical protein
MDRDLGVCSAVAAHAWWRSLRRSSSGGTITPPALTYERHVLNSRTSENLPSRYFRLAQRRDAATGGQATKLDNVLSGLLSRSDEEIASVRVLGPAFGSGNFLSASIQRLLNSEREVITFAAEVGLPTSFPKVGPEQVLGIGINEYAHELATAMVWIGYIQWLASESHLPLILSHAPPCRPLRPSLEKYSDVRQAHGSQHHLLCPASARDWVMPSAFVLLPLYCPVSRLRPPHQP